MATSPEKPAVFLSVIMITKNEVQNIKACLDSVHFADEVVIVDNESTDGTIELARAAGATVIVTNDWPGFGPQKSRALAAANGQWILSIDADERITPELEKEILQIIRDPNAADAYDISRRSWYCGRFIKHSGWTPDYVTRLFKRGKAQFTDHLVHERLVASGTVKQLKNVMLHYSYRNFSQVLQKVDNYSTLNAKQSYAKGKRAGIGTALLHGFWAFFRTYFIKRGILDGAHGIALAISNAETSYYRYLKLWLLEQESKTNTEN
jgi:glycosyltransferase involved in cell wall biosynthesis